MTKKTGGQRRVPQTDGARGQKSTITVKTPTTPTKTAPAEMPKPPQK